MLQNTETAEAKAPRYTLLAKVVMIGWPVLVYLFAGSLSSDMSAALRPSATPNVADLVWGGGLAVMRYGAIVGGVLGVWASFFGYPKDTAPKWMIRR